MSVDINNAAAANDLPSSLPHRGRARSGALHGDDGDSLIADVAALNGLPYEPKSEPDTSPKKGVLSKKTQKIMMDLNTALAPPVIEGQSPVQPEISAEEEAERALEEEEQKKRAAELAANPVTTGAGAAAKRAPRPRKGDENEYDMQMKILLLGDGGVGKTSLMLRYSENKFSTSLLSTAGVDYKTEFLDVDGSRVKCQIWDTAGQQRFHVITQAYYKGAHAIVLVYDVSDPTEESFNNVRYWVENIQKHANPQTLKMLIGNKIDVKGKKVETERGKALADEYGMKFFETSAKDGTNVTDAFHTLAREAVTRMIAQNNADAAAVVANGGTVKQLRDRKGRDCIIL